MSMALERCRPMEHFLPNANGRHCRRTLHTRRSEYDRIMLMRSTTSRVAMRLGLLAVRHLPMQTRVHVVESLSKDMISEIHVDGTVLRFQTSDSGSEYRAKTALTKESDTIAWIDSFDARSEE